MSERGDEVISSATNPLVKRLRSLAERKQRQRAGAFVVEGIQPVTRAIQAAWPVEVIIWCPELIMNPAVREFVEAQRAAGVRVAALTPQLFERISDRDTPAGLAAIVAMRRLGLSDLPDRAPGEVIVVLHEIGNPGNLGTIIRTADAAGATAVIITGQATDEFSPAAVKASMGSLFAMPVIRVAALAEVVDFADDHGLDVVATSGTAAVPLWPIAAWRPDPMRGVTLLFGSEGAGLPAEVLQRADHRVAIPMTGTAESLNLAVAAGVALYAARSDALAAGAT